jgi:hypothetical protein
VQVAGRALAAVLVTRRGAVGGGVLHVAARAASCDEHGGEGAACHLHQQDWGIPLRVVEGGPRRLLLPLSAQV